MVCERAYSAFYCVGDDDGRVLEWGGCRGKGCRGVWDGEGKREREGERGCGEACMI